MYTMLQYKTKLEKSKKSAKNTKRGIPPKGMGSGLERAYSK